MIRHFALSLGALLLAAGCGKNNGPEVREDCVYEKLDLSACDRSGLGALQTEGIWNMDLTFDDGEVTSGAIKYVGEPQISGLPITSTRVEQDTFLLNSEVQSSSGSTFQYLFAGCRAASPTQVEGVFRRCVNGTQDLGGTFRAARVQRRAGEGDSSRVELVSEKALPREEGKALPRGVDVFVAGGYAYISALGEGLFIYKVSDPAAPQLVARLKPPEADADAWHQVWVQGQTMYIASTKRGVIVYNVENPEAPVAVKSFPTDRAVEVRAVAMDGNWLYAASPYPNAEVVVFDATNPRELVVGKRYFVEQTQPELGERPYDVLARDGRLYVSHWTYGLVVSDVANPKAPKQLGRFAYSGATTRTVDVGTIGNRTLAFEAGEGWGAHLRVLDVSAPALITQVAEYALRPEVSLRAVKLVGTKLYLAHYQDGLRILDVSNPNLLQEAGYYNTWRETDLERGLSYFEGLSDVAVPGDGYIYATETSRGLLIFREP
ncbi:MAG TPA: hypothetical protein VNA24_17945 [Hyalangium sp.]|nr:hypothetical protein [Hyalangium sp.]